MLTLLFPLLLAISSPEEIAPLQPSPRRASLGHCFLRQTETFEMNGKLWLMFDCPESGSIVLQPAESFQAPAEKP